MKGFYGGKVNISPFKVFWEKNVILSVKKKIQSIERKCPKHKKPLKMHEEFQNNTDFLVRKHILYISYEISVRIFFMNFIWKCIDYKTKVS